MELRRHIIEVDKYKSHWGGFGEYKTIAKKETLEYKDKSGEWKEIPVHYDSFTIGEETTNVVN